MEEIVTPHEAQLETLLTLLAILLDRVGGELVISRRDFEMFDRAPVVGRYISKDYVLLRLAYEDEMGDMEEVDLPEENPPTNTK
jgi:hypothetical protein